MPFAPAFDDVYQSIKLAVTQGLATTGGQCSRLDEARPAGRITERLIRELKTSSFCVADLTGTSPNVMWEVGFAMALGKPVILICQDLQALPFDLRDMQNLEYKRNHLNSTLATPLRRMVIDTVSAGLCKSAGIETTEVEDELVAELKTQVTELRGIVSAVARWGHLTGQPPPVETPASHLKQLEGAWIAHPSGNHLYAEVIDGNLIAPYCYRSDHHLTGVYLGWRNLGDRWFARFTWLDEPLSGYAVLRQESVDLLHSTWWLENTPEGVMDFGMNHEGVEDKWRRSLGKRLPAWASEFLASIRENGLPKRLAAVAKDRHPLEPDKGR